MNVKHCEFNIDTACIDIVYGDNTLLSLYIPAIEDQLRTTVYSRSKLDFMLDNEPLEYARMALDSTLQDYVERIDGIADRQIKSYTEQLSERYSKNIAEDIAGEMVMYG